MDITKFIDFFHDGGIINIQQIKDNIEISMETSQILPEWNEDNIPLSDFQTLKGKLHLKRIKNILVNDELTKSIKMTYDNGEILDFEMYDNNRIQLLITWVNFPPKKREHVFEAIEIEAEEIYWETILDLFDPMISTRID